MGGYGMLQCTANFSNGYEGKNYKNCDAIDIESHRIDVCPLWRDINLCNVQESLDYSLIHSEAEIEITKIIEMIISMWDLGNATPCEMNGAF